MNTIDFDSILYAISDTNSVKAIREQIEALKEKEKEAKKTEREMKAKEKKEELEKKVKEKKADLEMRSKTFTNKNGYEIDYKGQILKTYNNYKFFVENSDFLKGKNIRFNEFAQHPEFGGEMWDDFTDAKINQRFALETGFFPVDKMIRTAIDCYLSEHTYNPILEYLDNLPAWDGKHRMETLFIDLLEADDVKINGIPIVRLMTKKWLLGAYERAINPGCKMDQMIILTGRGGGGKSSLCMNLSHNSYADNPSMDKSRKDFVEEILDKWFVIIDELGSFEKSSINKQKNLITAVSDHCRLSYLRRAKTYYRHQIFIGNTNDDTFLKDYSGDDLSERRYWPIKCKGKNKANDVLDKNSDCYEPDYYDQVWAEVIQYKKEHPGEKYYFVIDTPEDLAFREYQKQFKTMKEDSNLDCIDTIFDREFILNEKGELDSYEDLYEQVVGKSLKRDGWIDGKHYIKGKINKIPRSWVSLYFKKYTGEKRSTQYLRKYLLNMKSICYENRQIYNGSNLDCYVRINVEAKNARIEFGSENLEKNENLENLFNV